MIDNENYDQWFVRVSLIFWGLGLIFFLIAVIVGYGTGVYFTQNVVYYDMELIIVSIILTILSITSVICGTIIFINSKISK